jgi:hypothetical protein
MAVLQAGEDPAKETSVQGIIGDRSTAERAILSFAKLQRKLRALSFGKRWELGDETFGDLGLGKNQIRMLLR